MCRGNPYSLSFSLLAILVCFHGLAVADETTPTKDSSPLGIRQQRVKRMMQELDRKFQDLAQKLRETEPEQAKLLAKAYQRSRERLIEQRMDEIARLLDAAQLNDADQKQGEVRLELEALLGVLLDQTKNWDQVDLEIQRLEANRKAVQELLKKQREHLFEADRMANQDQTLFDLDQQIKELNELIDQQSRLNRRTEQAKENERSELGELATKQDELRKQTEQLGNSIAAPDSASSGPSVCKACLNAASQSQKSAAQKLAEALPKDAQLDEVKALEELKNAADKLKSERDRIARLPKEMLDQLAQRQDATAEDAKKLLDAMHQSPDGDSASGAKGQKNVQHASQAMQQASDGLRRAEAAAAVKEQEKAVEELKQALDEIEHRLAQLREETLIDRLARLEARFRDMLARQKEVTQSTTALHAKQTAQGKLSRADILNLRKLASEEIDLADQAHQAHEILIEDGTSVVFPSVVVGLQADLSRLARLLEDGRADSYTQALQADVETILQELIDALQRNLQKKKGEGGGGQCNCEPPLVPASAELKVLRSMQMRVHRRTELLDKLLSSGDLDDAQKHEVSALTEMQRKVAEMALQMAEKY